MPMTPSRGRFLSTTSPARGSRPKGGAASPAGLVLALALAWPFAGCSGGGTTTAPPDATARDAARDVPTSAVDALASDRPADAASTGDALSPPDGGGTSPDAGRDADPVDGKDAARDQGGDGHADVQSPADAATDGARDQKTDTPAADTQPADARPADAQPFDAQPTDAHVDVTSDAGPDYGLAARPVNTTCLASAVPPTFMTGDPFPALLSQSGCVDKQDPTKPAAAVIPYDVRSPLWSDGAEKLRYFALPEGGKIHVNADGDWDFPAGTVLMKTFLLGGKRIETRLLMRHTGGDGSPWTGVWQGYSYQWSDDQKDATLLDGPAFKDFTVNGATQTWNYPSTSDCGKCHLEVDGYSLGLETAQFNGDFAYPSGKTANQLATLEHIGLFDAPLPGAPAALPALPSPTGTADVASRARSYLHTNCSICHRPGVDATFGAKIDLRFTPAFKDMGICNVAPVKGDLGVSGAMIFAPGKPAQSVLSLRSNTNDMFRMPPLARKVIHTEGVQLLNDWISSVTSCP